MHQCQQSSMDNELTPSLPETSDPRTNRTVRSWSRSTANRTSGVRRAFSPNEPSGVAPVPSNEPKRGDGPGSGRRNSPNEPTDGQSGRNGSISPIPRTRPDCPARFPERTQDPPSGLPERTGAGWADLPERTRDRDPEGPERTQRQWRAISSNEPRDEAGTVSPNEPGARRRGRDPGRIGWGG
jgi:hypothetical protein